MAYRSIGENTARNTASSKKKNAANRTGNSVSGKEKMFMLIIEQERSKVNE